MPEKFNVGIRITIAVAKIAAICDFTKQDTNKPNAVDAVMIKSAPKVIAHMEPLTGTANTTTEIHTIIK